MPRFDLPFRVLGFSTWMNAVDDAVLMKPKAIKHYELIRRLGAGGSGVAYLANDTKLLRPVVIKMLRGQGTSERERATILREARLASAIEHPNVCAIYEVDEVDEQLFIVMQKESARGGVHHLLETDGFNKFSIGREKFKTQMDVRKK